MRIIVRESEKKRIFIPIPNFIVTSKWVLRKILKYADLGEVTKQQVKTLVREFRKVRRNFNGLLLVDVEASDGTVVKIYL